MPLAAVTGAERDTNLEASSCEQIRSSYEVPDIRPSSGVPTEDDTEIPALMVVITQVHSSPSKLGLHLRADGSSE